MVRGQEKCTLFYFIVEEWDKPDYLKSKLGIFLYRIGLVFENKKG